MRSVTGEVWGRTEEEQEEISVTSLDGVKKRQMTHIHTHSARLTHTINRMRTRSLLSRHLVLDTDIFDLNSPVRPLMHTVT